MRVVIVMEVQCNVQPANKVEFHSAPIIDPRPIPPALDEVSRQLADPLTLQPRYTLMQLRGFLESEK